MGIVYKIVDKREPDVVLYVGSTIKPLLYRWCGHVVDYKRYNSPIYEHMREAGGIDHFEPIAIARFNCTTKELREHEQTYMNKLTPKLNRRRAMYLGSKHDYNKAYNAEHREKYNARRRARYAARRASLQRIHHATLLETSPHIRSAANRAVGSERPGVHSVEAS